MPFPAQRPAAAQYRTPQDPNQAAASARPAKSPSLTENFANSSSVSFTGEELEKGEVYYNFRMGTFPSEEAPGLSVFYKDGSGDIFHTYSSYARGLDRLIGTYQYLDLVPKGRDEAGLSFTMEWVRRHDRYDD